MAIMYTIETMRALQEKKAAILKAKNIRVTDFSFCDTMKELFISYEVGDRKASTLLEHTDLIEIIQFDPTVYSYDASRVTDEDKIFTYSYDEYFMSCPKALILDFLIYHLLLRRGRDVNNVLMLLAA